MEQAFTPHVVELVTGDSEDKTKSWEERKQAALDSLRRGNREHRMLMCADKLANLRNIRLGLAEEIFPAQQM